MGFIAILKVVAKLGGRIFVAEGLRALGRSITNNPVGPTFGQATGPIVEQFEREGFTISRRGPIFWITGPGLPVGGVPSEQLAQQLVEIEMPPVWGRDP